MEKKKILFFLHTMRGGGVENVLLNIFNNFEKTNFQFTLLLIRKEGDFFSQIPKNVQIKYLALGNEFLSNLKFINILQKIYRKVKLKILLKNPYFIRKFFISEFNDVEIAFLGDLIPILDKIKRADSFTIGWVHGDIYASRSDLNMKKEILSSSLNLDKVVYVSNKALENGILWNPKISSNAIVIYNPIDKENILSKSLKKIDFNYDEITFICVGRLSGIKGYDNVLKVHQRLIKDGFRHHVIIIGKGEDESIVRSTIEKYKIRETFHLLGHKQNPFPYLKASDIYLLNSKSEGYPLAVKEALLLGKPMIVTNVGGVTEIVDESNAIIIDYDENQLYNAMKKMITDKEFRNKLQLVNQKHYKEYDQNIIYNSYKKLLNSQKVSN
ncbi:glycosyltransferase [Apibacter sp. HY039]|uniref:glycosyltransferase n=1 Tax=Apibacter sp. HY039 TaxID=2501476 RepID=UPI000FEBC033|nr:glycosyltransferase [Apibacter sp. HY039]